MKIRGRVLVLAVSLPVIAFAVIGGFMSNAMARQDSYQYLRMFEDVVSLIMSNYVEDVNVDKVMHGAMHGLADGLDPDSAFLDAAQVKVHEKGDPGGVGQTGVELTRQYYLRVIAARDDSLAMARRPRRPLCCPTTTSAPSMASQRATPRCTKASACSYAARERK